MSDRHAGGGRWSPGSDAELRDLLLAEGCSGPVWQRFATELARYGYAVLMAWLRSEAIFAKCAEVGCPLGPPPPHWEHDDRAGLAVDTVVEAISGFRREALLAGGWSHGSGTSLKSCFTTTCVHAFPAHYRRWREEFDRRRPGRAPTGPVARGQAIGQVIGQGLDVLDERTRRALVLRQAGYTVAETAELLDTSPGAINGALERLRKSGGGRSAGNGGGNA